MIFVLVLFLFSISKVFHVLVQEQEDFRDFILEQFACFLSLQPGLKIEFF